MTTPGRRRVLYIIVCAAGPAGDVGKLVTLAHQHNWDVQIIATPAALNFIDTAALEAQTGRPVRSDYREPGQPRSPKADAIIVAPATYNTINKWANGIADNYALSILAEAPNLNIPIVVLPFVNTALATRRPFQQSTATLQAEGVHLLLGPGKFEPHPPGAGNTKFNSFPWEIALETVEASTNSP